MKRLSLILFLLLLAPICYSQPPDIKAIMDKLKSGKGLTEGEEEKFEKWLEGTRNRTKTTTASVNGTKAESVKLCPEVLKSFPDIAPLNRESYVALAKSLMATFGPKTGNAFPGLQKMMSDLAKPTDGSDIGGLFIMTGFGSAAVFAAASSAAKQPEDLLTANTLGVALKDMAEYRAAIQVLEYADKLKPGIPLISVNLGWVYREMGNPVMAKKMFEKALALSPGYTTPHLGLGLIAECEGNHALAVSHLRKALAGNYSAAGVIAFKQAKAAQSSANGNPSDQSIPKEKGEAGEVKMPELPVFEQMEKMQQQGPPLESFIVNIDSRMNELTEQYKSALSIVMKQGARANQDPGNSVVFRRDFAAELMMMADVTDLLFGPNSNYGKAVVESAKKCETTSKSMEKNMPGMLEDIQKLNRIQNELNKYLMEFTKQLQACAGNEQCAKKAEADYEAKCAPLNREVDEMNYRLCIKSKGDIEMLYSCQFKYYSQVSGALYEAVDDYYAFTNPILERIYAPSFNELMNTWRELFIYTKLKQVAEMAAGLPDLAENHNDLKCVEPKTPEPSVEAKEPELPKEKPGKCPLGEGIKAGFGSFSAELTCDYVKISGGEGILGSVARDFKKHETTIMVGVGARVEYGHGNLTGEASVGVEVTLGRGNTVNNLALTSTVKAGLGGLVEGEINGRISVQGGPEITTDAGFTAPDIPGLN